MAQIHLINDSIHLFNDSIHLFNDSIHLINDSIHLINDSTHLFNDDCFRTIEGCAEACGCLARIFSRPQKQPVNDIYLAQFYDMIRLSLKNTSHPSIISAILLNSSTLFSRNLKGLRKLVPYYLIAIARIFSEVRIKIGQDVNLIKLSRAGVSILGQIVAVCNRFPNTPVETFDLTPFPDQAFTLKVYILKNDDSIQLIVYF